MIKLVASVCIAAPASAVWTRRAHREAIHKYFVEHGQPYAGKAAELPSVPVTGY